MVCTQIYYSITLYVQSNFVFTIFNVALVRDVGLGILKKEMSSLVIPPINGTAHIKVGKVDYTVSK